MKRRKYILCFLLTGFILFPLLAGAQTLSGSGGGLKAVLDQLYNDMIPMCSQLVDVGRAIAGFAALTYIAIRVWRHIARAEPIDFYPLLRPFALGMVIMMFPLFIAMINGALNPIATATGNMVTQANESVATLLQQQQNDNTTQDWQNLIGQNTTGNNSLWNKYTQPDDETGSSSSGFFEGLGNALRFSLSEMYHSFTNTLKEMFRYLLQLLFEAASLCIDTIRIFHLIILTILGPLAIGLSVFDGFQQTFTAWLARYINIFMWLPVANIFGAVIATIQEHMLQLDGSFLATTAYLVFLLIAIIGYTTVPSIANYIIHPGGGKDTLLHKVSGLGGSGGQAAAGAVVKGVI
jgi:conjugative transposon TraJ protein